MGDGQGARCSEGMWPGYGLGLMQGVVNIGLIFYGHTGTGPGSVVAVYRSAYGADTASCAVFREGSGEGFGPRITVGMPIAERPSHRSVRARFGHTAPTLDE